MRPFRFIFLFSFDGAVLVYQVIAPHGFVRRGGPFTLASLDVDTGDGRGVEEFAYQPVT